MTAKIIVNPYAGRWKARRAVPEIHHACAEVGLDYELVETAAPNHGVELARDALLAGYSPIVSAGGDGSISEVVNGMMQGSGGESPRGPLGVIPLGSADDLSDMLGLEKDVVAACRTIVAGRERWIDLGRVNGRYFDNNSAIGLEPVVTLTQARLVRLHGTPRYVIAALSSIWTHRPWHVRMVWDDGEYEGPVALVSVGNTRRTGGAFFMTPHAEPDDGQLDFVFARATNRLRLLRILPTAFDGHHIDEPEIEVRRATRLTIECNPPTPIHADGEIIDTAATRIAYDVLPGHLRVLIPSVE